MFTKKKGPMPTTLEKCKITVFPPIRCLTFGLSSSGHRKMTGMKWGGRPVQSEQSNSPNTSPMPPLPSLIFAGEI